MPGIVSGLNQKRQSGKITNGTFIISNTKGRGSTTRMLNYCTQHSENSSDCINEFIAQAPNPAPNQDILFNISTFSNLFDYDGTGAKKLPTKYLNGLISAANRWNTYIKFNRDTINLIRNISTNNNWNGIELTNVTYITSTYEAAVRTSVINYTTLNISFTLDINNNAIGSLNDSELSDVFTHELGHVLGFINWPSRVDGKENGEILLPKFVPNIAFQLDPLCTINPPYKNMNIGYNNYWGTIDYLNSKVDNATTTPIILDSNGLHLTGYFNSIEPPPQPSTRNGKYLKRGFANEIMVRQFTTGNKYYISQVSLGYLLDLFTNWRGSKYFNYILKNANSEANPAVAGSFNVPPPGENLGPLGQDAYIYFNKNKGIKSLNLNTNNILEKTTIKTFTCHCCDVVHLKI
jgi:hypothetical protein